MIKEFTYSAPVVPFNTASADLIAITTNYSGAATIWIYVDSLSGKNPRFVSEGNLADPTSTDTSMSIMLSAENSNHVLLMDMLASSRAHVHTTTVTSTLNQVGDIASAPDYIFSYSIPEFPCSVTTYNLAETSVSNTGIVTYQFATATADWDLLEPVVRMQKTQSEAKTRDPIVIAVPAALAQYQRHVAVLTFIEEHFMNKVDAWKVIVPLVHEV